MPDTTAGRLRADVVGLVVLSVTRLGRAKIRAHTAVNQHHRDYAANKMPPVFARGVFVCAGERIARRDCSHGECSRRVVCVA